MKECKKLHIVALIDSSRFQAICVPPELSDFSILSLHVPDEQT